MIIAYSAEIGLGQRTLTDDEVVSRCVLALVNEGARVVEEGIAYRPVDVEVVYLTGYGFPARRGGPMFHSDLVGPASVLKTIEHCAQACNWWAWEPAPLLVALAARDRRFAKLNR